MMQLFAAVTMFGLLATQAHAGTWNYVQNGVSKHFGTVQVKTGESVERRTTYLNDRKITVETRTDILSDYNFNENNIGGGLEYSEQLNHKVTNYYGGYYLDSFRNDAYYLGMGWAYRMKPLPTLSFDTGGLLTLLSRKNINDGVPFPAVLPYVSLGGETVAMNLTFIPGIKDISVPTLFMQMKIKIKN